jgi:hypothetical protein
MDVSPHKSLVTKDHTGLAVILDYYGVGNFSFPEVLPASIGKTAPPLFPSMTIMITGCTFEVSATGSLLRPAT